MRSDDNLTSEIAAAGGLYEFITSPRHEKLSGFHQLRALALLAAAIVALNWYAPSHLTFGERFYASAIIALMGIPAWLWKNGFDRCIPFMLMVMLVYVYDFALSAFLLDRFALDTWSASLAPQLIERALEYSFIGISCMLLGYYGPLFILARPIMPRLNLCWHNPRAIRIAGLFFSFGGLAFVLVGGHFLPKSLAQLGVLGADLCTIGMCALLILQLLGLLNLATKLMLWGFFMPVRLGLSFSTGFAGGAFGIALVLAVAYASVRRRIPWALIIAGTLALFVLRALEVPYRAATWEARGTLSDASTVTKLEYIGNLAYRATVGGEVPFDFMVQASAARLAQFTLFADVIRDTPASVPYWDGATYYPLFFKLIPRFIYPDKPQELTGQTFGHRYGLLYKSDSGTSMGLPEMVELYANFGLVGVIVGMTLFGLLYRLLMELFVHPEMGFGALIGAIFLVGLAPGIGSEASIALGAIPWQILFIVAITFVVEIMAMDLGTIEAAAARA